MKTLAVILLLASLPCVGQQTTIGQRNGRFWNSLSVDSKVVYLVALQEGFDLGHDLGRFSVLNRAFPWTESKTIDQRIKIMHDSDGDVEEDLHHYFSSTMTFGEIAKGLDHFYGEPENLILPVVDGLELFALKVNGTTQEAIATKVAAYRLRYVKAVEEEQKKKTGVPAP
jgi:hypothetical protein